MLLFCFIILSVYIGSHIDMEAELLQINMNLKNVAKMIRFFVCHLGFVFMTISLYANVLLFKATYKVSYCRLIMTLFFLLKCVRIMSSTIMSLQYLPYYVYSHLFEPIVKSIICSYIFDTECIKIFNNYRKYI